MKLQEIFEGVPDFRVAGRTDHYLSEILVISLCAVLSGAEDFEDIAEYGRQKKDFLFQFLELPNGIPSHDTFNRVFRLMDKASFQACLVRWSREIVSELEHYQVNIDGKVLRATGKKGKKTDALCLVSAWVSEHCLSLGQTKVAKKSNEKTAIPDLLENIDIERALVSIDAMGCHSKIAALIRDNQADYLLGLKQNQKGLYEEIHDWMEARKESLDKDVQTDYVGGRIETRTTYVCSDLRYIDELSEWKDCQRIVMVKCQRSFKNNPSSDSFKTRFYVSSAAKDAVYFGLCTRRHWSIENQLHWYLDVVFDEDRQRVRKDNAPDNMATLRKMALQLLLAHKGKDSLKKVRKRAAWNDNFLIQLLNSIENLF
jgi:predicted transposase YbfD/YdcC